MGSYVFLWAPTGFFNGWFGVALLSMILLLLTACCCRWCYGMCCDIKNLARKKDLDDIESEISSQEESHKSLPPWTTYQENLKRTSLNPDDAFPHVITAYNHTGREMVTFDNLDIYSTRDDEKLVAPSKIPTSTPVY